MSEEEEGLKKIYKELEQLKKMKWKKEEISEFLNKTRENLMGIFIHMHLVFL